MNEEQHLAKLANAIVTFDVHEVKQIVREALRAGILSYKILTEGLALGIKIVGQKYENGEYFLPELVMAGETMKQAIYVLKPFLKTDKSGAKGRVVIGTVEGDIHDIGKNLVITFLTAAGLEVYDLGVDVPAGKFVKKVKETEASVLCLSALLTTTIPEMKNVIDTLKRVGIRKMVKVVVGGAPLNEEIAKKVGADLYGGDAADGAALIVDRYFSD
jgi:corrinoid protein of di/trimethylamine methyltransferase